MVDSDDLEAIQQLKARYFRLLDTKEWAALAELFTAEVEIDMGAEGGRVTRHPADFVTGLREVIGDAVTVHQGHMPEITLTSASTAAGIWAMEDLIWWPEDSPVAHLHGYGHYHERYEKADGSWRIAAMRLTRLRRHLEA